MNMVEINDKKINGPFGFFLAIMILGFMGIVFLFISVILLIPIWLPILIGVLIGKTL